MTPRHLKYMTFLNFKRGIVGAEYWLPANPTAFYKQYEGAFTNVRQNLCYQIKNILGLNFYRYSEDFFSCGASGLP